ncbi:MAG: SCO family protein [Pyrinomonadaceae bacterium]|nr:SCO family protein [Pyrinomonadaceae bacterium]MCX7640857.1 SCO family protein [Pyrinomonadaceae bacterium]MDW8304570.1 SCO family protein [Acidobacteriota bacterium]
MRFLSKVYILILVASIFVQGQQHYNSPLYAPRNYEPGQNVGIPQILKEVGIEQKLGNQLPLNVEFKNEDGQIVELGNYFGKGRPVILALVYYECPMLCNEVLNGLTGALKGISLDAGKDFDVLAISFDARENDIPELAKNKKAAYLRRYERTGAENGWHFLTGTQKSIDAVTEAVGFQYRWDEKTNQFAHVGGVIVLTPEARVSKYFYGIEYSPLDLKLALIEASEEKIGSLTDRLLLYCYHYDPAAGTYGFAILRVIRVAGVLTLVGLAGMFIYFWRKGRVSRLK